MTTELEQNVVQALGEGRKIAAIKLLRESRNIGLKEAKDLVDQYLSENPESASAIQRASGGGGFILVVVLIIFASLLYAYTG